MDHTDQQAGSSYLVLITNWPVAGAYWLKGFPTLEQAKETVRERIAHQETIKDNIMIIKGEVIQLGGGS